MEQNKADLREQEAQNKANIEAMKAKGRARPSTLKAYDKNTSKGANL